MASGVILVLGRAGDPTVERLRTQAPDCVRHVAPADLTRPGWRQVPGDPGAAVAVAGGTRVPAAEVAAVVVRLHAIEAFDLPHIDPDDRRYVAAEATAFLIAWLAQSRALRVNPPAPTSLCGPGFGPGWWARQAASAGVEVWPARDVIALGRGGVPAGLPAVGEAATVVGGQVLGSRVPDVVGGARRLAAAVRLPLLRVQFLRGRAGGWAFAGADACPPLDEESAAAVLALASRPSGRRMPWTRC